MPRADGGGLAATTRDLARGVPLARVALPGILALGLALRLWGIGSDSLWLDEGFAWNASKRDLLSLPGFLSRSDTHPPLYYGLLHVWRELFGDSEAALRSLSALTTLLLVPVVYALGRRLGGARTGLVAALFAAVSPALVRYGQEARMYGLLALLSGLSFLVLLQLLERRTRLRVALYAAATTLLLYTHVYSLFVLLAEAAYVLLHLRASRPAGADRRRELKAMAAVAAVPLVLWAPWTVALARQSRLPNLDWLGPPTARQVVETFGIYTGSRGSLVAIAAIAAVMAAVLVRSAPGWRGLLLHPGLLPGWLLLLVPIALPFVLSWAVRPIYQPKYTIPASIGFTLLLAVGSQRLPGARLQAAAVAAIALTLLGGSVWYLTAFDGDRWRNAVRYLDGAAAPGDLVIFEPDYERQTVFAYYNRRADLVLPANRREALSRTTVWLVGASSGEPERLVAGLVGRGYVVASQRRFDGRYEDLEITRFRRAP